MQKILKTKTSKFIFFIILFVVVILIGCYCASTSAKETSFIYTIITLSLSLTILFKIADLTPLEERFPVPRYRSKNSLIPKAIKQVSYLFKLAQGEILIVSNHLDHRFYDSDQILDIIRKAVSKGVIVKIICENHIDKKTVKFIQLCEEEKNKIQIFKISQDFKESEEIKKHLMIVDNIHTRIEKIHGKNREKRTADFYFFDDYLGNSATNKFTALLQKSESLN